MENLTESAAVSVAPVIESVKAFCAKNAIIEVVPKVRVNDNGYPYVTFINKDNEATNVYFSINAAGTVEENQDIREIAKDLQIVYVKNAAGEDRIKLSRKSASRITVEDLF